MIIKDLEIEMVEQDFINEKKAAAREFEDHKVRRVWKSNNCCSKMIMESLFFQVYLKDQLISELEEKQKIIEAERHNMELTGDTMELKTITTRKLRRRANEPSSKYS